MTEDLRFERSARDWLELGPVEAPAGVVQAALLEIDTTSQERDLRVPWRFQTMPTLARVLIAAAVVIGLVAGGTLFLQRSNQELVGAPSPSPTLASPAPSPSPAPSTADVGPHNLSMPFVSSRYGYTVPIDPSWVTQQASVTWTGPDNSTPVIDELAIPGTEVAFNGASQSLAPGQSLTEWLSTFQSEENAASSCYGGPSSAWPTREIGGRAWTWAQGCTAATAITEDGGRAYVFTCSGCTETSDDVNALFEQMLSGAQLDPTLAASPPPPPPLPQSFVGDRNGFQLQVPAGWSVVQRSTGASPRDRLPVLDDPGLDVLGDDSLRLAVTSFPLRKGETAAEWAGAFCDFAATVWSPPCDQAPGVWETVPLKSGTAWLAVNGDTAATFPQNDSRLFLATAVDGRRAYEIRLEGNAERSLFLAILQSMSLDPASAPDATPRP